MSVAVQTRLIHEDIKPCIGSRIRNSKEELLSGELSPAIRALLEQRGMVAFPGIDMTDAEQVAFTKTLGTFAIEGGRGETVSPISLDVKANPRTANYLKGSLYWHIDGTDSKVPILASVLSCRVNATEGGNTGFSNTYAAYEALSDADKARYEKMRVVHAPWASLFYYDPEPSLAMLKGMQSIGEQELPLVWKHRSGRKSLVLGCTLQRVVGLSAMESAEVIVALREWATQDAFTCSYEWSVGDMVIWDNTGTMHRAEWYDPAGPRMMHRTRLHGEEPFE